MSTLFFILRTFDWDGGNGFFWRGRCKDWDAITPQVSVSKNPDLQKNTWVHLNIGFDPGF